MKVLNKSTMSGVKKDSDEWLNSPSKKGVRTPVSQLRTGMFVAELDRPWMGTPFATQGFLIGHPDQIHMLAEYCQHVYVVENNTSLKKRSKTLAKPQQSSLQKKSSSAPFAPSVQGRKNQDCNALFKKRITIQKNQDFAYTIQLPAEQEHPAARAAYDQAKLILEGIIIAVQYGSEPDIQRAEDAVRACRESVVRNPNALVWMSKIKDDNAYIIGHGLSVCILAMVFGRHLNFTESELDALGLCGLLHDVGKVKIPAHVQNKRGSLTTEELRLIKQHTIDGYKILRANKTQFTRLTDVALNHHERPDGRGYPRSLKHHEISDYAKIIAIVEAYDAMTSDRCYAQAKGPVDAHKEVYANLGKQFDEEYALQFMQAIGPYPPGTVVELRNGMVGIVLTGHPKFRHLPTVILLRDEDKKIIEEEVVDLSLTDVGKLDKDYLIQRPLRDGTFGVSLKGCKLESQNDVQGSTAT